MNRHSEKLRTTQTHRLICLCVSLCTCVCSCVSACVRPSQFLFSQCLRVSSSAYIYIYIYNIILAIKQGEKLSILSYWLFSGWPDFWCRLVNKDSPEDRQHENKKREFLHLSTPFHSEGSVILLSIFLHRVLQFIHLNRFSVIFLS